MGIIQLTEVESLPEIKSPRAKRTTSLSNSNSVEKSKTITSQILKHSNRIRNKKKDKKF